MDSMCVSTRLRDAFHATVTLHQRITEDKMEAPLGFIYILQIK